MSRIDQALKRVAATSATANAGTAQGTATVAPGEVRLEHYPLEEPPVVEPVPVEIRPPISLAEPHAPQLRIAAVRRRRNGTPQSAALWADRLVTSHRVSDLAVEQYRRLAAAIHDLQVTRGLKTLMVTSALPQDGKTLTAVNLALTLSGSYARRVLLIDADLRRPSLQDVFSLPDGPGLGEFLRSEALEPELIEVAGGLQVLQAGHAEANPIAGLTSGRMRVLLDQVASRFDWVLVDTPPVGLLTDGQLLARLISAVIFVIGAGSTPWPVAEKAIAELGRDCIIGTVLNAVEENSIAETAYYRRYYRTRESGEREKSTRSEG